MTGSVEEQALLGAPALLAVPDARAGAAAVESGLADALVLSLPAVRAIAREHPGLEAVPASGIGPAGQVANAFRPEDQGLLAAWSRAQADVLASPAHLREIAAFGFARGDVPTHPGATPGADR